MTMSVASCICKNTCMTHGESVECLTAIWVKTKVRVAAFSFCPLLVMPHDDDRSCRCRQLIIEPFELWWVDAPSCLKGNRCVDERNSYARQLNPLITSEYILTAIRIMISASNKEFVSECTFIVLAKCIELFVGAAFSEVAFDQNCIRVQSFDFGNCTSVHGDGVGLFARK